MRATFTKKVLGLLIASLTLTSCSILSMFGGGDSSTDSSDHPYSGHYLFDHYRPTKDKNPGVYYAHGDNTLRLDGEQRYESFLFNLDDASQDATVTFEIDSGKYRSLCFLAGTAEDRLTQYDIGDKCAFSVWLDGKKAYEEMYYALGPSRYISIDISGASSLTFFVSEQFSTSVFACSEVTLWEDANHSVAPVVEHATEEEDFFDHTYFVFGAGTNGESTIAHIDDNQYFVILHEEEQTVTVNNRTIDRGLAFTTRSWFDADSSEKIVFNALGRYKYLHFHLGHIDTSKTDGNIYVRVSVDREVKLLQLAKDTDLPHDITIDVNYGKTVMFEVFPDPQDKERTDMFSYGSYCIYDMIGSPKKDFPKSGDEKTYSGSYKLISEVGKPYNFVCAYDDTAILTGKTAYAGAQMCGMLYSEGLIMKSVYHMLTTTVGAIEARADFDIKRAFKYVTFKVGRRDKSALVNDALKIYLDDELEKTIELSSMGSVEEYQVTCTGARVLSFVLEGKDDTYRGTYGIVDIGVHTDRVRSLDFDCVPNGKKAAKDQYDRKEEVTLMRDILPYESFSAANEQDILTDDRKDTAEYTANDGREFEALGKKHSEGVVLQTGTYMSMGGGAAASAIACMAVGFALLVPLGASDVNCSSVAAFNLRDKFSSLSFKVAPLEDGGKSETLELISPEASFKKVTLSPTEETTVTVSVSGIEEFAFFLRFDESGSVPFGLYDMVLTAK